MYELYDGRIIERADAYKVLMIIKNSNPFTEEQSMEDYCKGLRKRMAKVDNRIVKLDDYEGMVKSLVNNKVIRLLA